MPGRHEPVRARAVCMFMTLALGALGCDGPAASAPDGGPPDAGPAPDAPPVPYDLPADCAAAASWTGVEPPFGFDVVGFGTEEVWLLSGSREPGGADLHRYGPEGPRAPHGRTDVMALWACAPDDVWLAGAGGLVLRWNGTELVDMDFPVGVDIWDGAGCHGDAWVVAEEGLYRHDGTTWHAHPFDVVDWPDFLPSEPLPVERPRVYRTAGIVAVLGFYGRAFVERPDGRFQYVETTDDVNTALLLDSDRKGFSVHNGHVLTFDGTMAYDPMKDYDLDVVAVDVSRRGDGDAWFAGYDQAAYWDGATFTRETLPFRVDAVDARSTSVWVTGYLSLGYRSRAGWCTIAAPMARGAGASAPVGRADGVR